MCSMSTAMASDQHNIYVSKNPSNNPSHPIPHAAYAESSDDNARNFTSILRS